MIIGSQTRKFAGVAFALAALTTSAAIMAQDDLLTETVQFNDLNLTTETGVDLLDRRLNRAVKRVCGSAPIQSASANRRVRHCQDQAWVGIEPQRSFAIASANNGNRQTEIAVNARGATIRLASAD